MKLTRKKALQLCKEHWLWLAENPDKEKIHWPKFQKYSYMSGNCFCCEYSTTHRRPYCGKKCILSNLWPMGCDKDATSPYVLWTKTENLETRKRMALAIATGCDEALELLHK